MELGLAKYTTRTPIVLKGGDQGEHETTIIPLRGDFPEISDDQPDRNILEIQETIRTQVVQRLRDMMEDFKRKFEECPQIYNMVEEAIEELLHEGFIQATLSGDEVGISLSGGVMAKQAIVLCQKTTEILDEVRQEMGSTRNALSRLKVEIEGLERKAQKANEEYHSSLSSIPSLPSDSARLQEAGRRTKLMTEKNKALEQKDQKVEQIASREKVIENYQAALESFSEKDKGTIAELHSSLKELLNTFNLPLSLMNRGKIDSYFRTTLQVQKQTDKKKNINSLPPLPSRIKNSLETTVFSLIAVGLALLINFSLTESFVNRGPFEPKKEKKTAPAQIESSCKRAILNGEDLIICTALIIDEQSAVRRACTKIFNEMGGLSFDECMEKFGAAQSENEVFDRYYVERISDMLKSELKPFILLDKNKGEVTIAQLDFPQIISFTTLTRSVHRFQLEFLNALLKIDNKVETIYGRSVKIPLADIQASSLVEIEYFGNIKPPKESSLAFIPFTESLDIKEVLSKNNPSSP